MTTRLSKIARLPAPIRQELNLRLHNGQFGRKILPWVNNLPETKEVLAENFDAKPITHQNLSEWRYTGYQDWLQQQERKEWFTRLTEQDNELDDHDQCGDPYEAMSRFFLVEIGQAFAALKNIKNQDARFTRLQNLTREFARLQNAYNWSRRVGIDWEKYNDQFPPEPEEPNENEILSLEPSDNHDHTLANGDRARPGRSETRPRGSHLRVESSDTVVPSTAADVRREAHRTAVGATALPEPKRQGAGALQDAPRASEAEDQRASPAAAGDCACPLPLAEEKPQAPAAFDPIPPLAPTTPLYPNPPAGPLPLSPRPSKPHTSPLPLRGRRFVCIEG